MDSKELVRRVLSIGALEIDGNNFFNDRGLNKPIYHRFDLLFFDHRDRENINNYFIELMDKSNISLDFFATTSYYGAIIAASLANYYNKSFVFLRDSEKQIGGKRYKTDCVKNPHSLDGKRAVLIDTINISGESIARSAFAISEFGANCNNFVTIFDYNLEISKRIFNCNESFNLKGSKLTSRLNVFPIFNLETLLKIATENRYIDNKQKDRIISWKNNYK